MGNFLVIDMDDQQYIWDMIQKYQVIFHPEMAPEGKFNYSSFFRMKSRKPYMLVLDRNILSGLIHLCENGELSDKGESQLIGIIMTWAEMNCINISAGYATMEYASSVKNQEQAIIEIGKFQKIIDYYPGNMWLQLAKGEITKIPVCNLHDVKAEGITAKFAEGSDIFFLSAASMMRLVQIYRNHEMRPADRFMSFLEWIYDNVRISEYVLVYALLLFSNQEGIKAPKWANSNDVEKIVRGCGNQAWDLTYLANLSRLHANNDEYKEDFLFATNDILLKKIFINDSALNNLYRLICTVFPIDYERICLYIDSKRKNRVVPTYKNDYYVNLFEKEKTDLVVYINSLVKR